MKLALMCGRPPAQLRREWSSRDAAELYAAERAGLLPDWWVMLGVLCQATNPQEKMTALDYIPAAFRLGE